jgi:hypothetical protein
VRRADQVGGREDPRLEDEEECTTMWVNMYRLRVGQRLRELAVLTAVGAALNMGGVEDTAPATQATASDLSSEQWAPAPELDAMPGAVPQSQPAPTHEWPRKHRSRADHDARRERLEEVRKELEEAHSHLRACIAASREAREAGTHAARAATAANRAAAAAQARPSPEAAVVVRMNCDRRAPRVSRKPTHQPSAIAAYSMRP